MAKALAPVLEQNPWVGTHTKKGMDIVKRIVQKVIRIVKGEDDDDDDEDDYFMDEFNLMNEPGQEDDGKGSKQRTAGLKEIRDRVKKNRKKNNAIDDDVENIKNKLLKQQQKLQEDRAGSSTADLLSKVRASVEARSAANAGGGATGGGSANIMGMPVPAAAGGVNTAAADSKQ